MTIIIQAEGMTYSIDAVVNVVTKSMRLASIFVPGIQSGETHTMKEWVEILGIKYGTLQSRIARGWSYKKALTKK